MPNNAGLSPETTPWLPSRREAARPPTNAVDRPTTRTSLTVGFEATALLRPGANHYGAAMYGGPPVDALRVRGSRRLFRRPEVTGGVIVEPIPKATVASPDPLHKDRRIRIRHN